MVRSGNLKPLFYGKLWADSIYKYAGATPVIFIDSYALPALYSYYHPDVQTASVNTINYRKNHFTISDDEIEFNDKKALVEVARKIDSSDYFISTPYTNTYLHFVDSFKALGVLNIKWMDIIKKGKPGEEKEILVSITNDSHKSIEVSQEVKLNYSFFKTAF